MITAREFLKCVLVPEGSYALQKCIRFIQIHFNYFWNCIYHTTANTQVSCSFINCQAVSTLSCTFRFSFWRQITADLILVHVLTIPTNEIPEAVNVRIQRGAKNAAHPRISATTWYSIPLVREAVTLYSPFPSYRVHMSTRIKPRSWGPYWSTRVPDWIKRQAEWGMRGQHMPEASACSHVDNSKWRSGVCG